MPANIFIVIHTLSKVVAAAKWCENSNRCGRLICPEGQIQYPIQSNPIQPLCCHTMCNDVERSHEINELYQN